MSYTIRVRVYQTNKNAYFHCIERGVWYYANGGAWTDTDSLLVLTMGGSGTSGMLRYVTETGTEVFSVALGVHEFNPWVDIVADLTNDITVVKALPEYYDETNPKARSREMQKTSQSIVNAESRSIAATFTQSSGQNLELAISIG